MTQAQMKELKTLLKGYRHINKKIIRSLNRLAVPYSSMEIIAKLSLLMEDTLSSRKHQVTYVEV